MPATVITVEAARVDNPILLDYLASTVAHEEPEIRSTDPNIPIDHNFTDGEVHFGMPGGNGDHKDESDDSDMSHAIPTASLRRQPASELERFELGTSDFGGSEGEDGNDAHADEEEVAAHADDGSTQNVED